ncbi:MAG: YicC family protein [Gemmatimonadetes bacterium]|nr:YicC family protein [Gemmatimonadota bacterium]
MPPRSMTGFGAAEGSVAGGRLRLEVRSVNHRHLSVQLKLPPELSALEGDVRERLRGRLARGHVVVSGGWIEDPPQAAGAVVDADRARALVSALRELGRSLGVPGDVDLATVARLPDVVRGVRAETAVEASAVLVVLDRAVGQCVAMREREGTALAADLSRRLETLAALAQRVWDRAPARLVAERDRLAAAVQVLAGSVGVDAARLAQEVAFRADRLDVTEELVRFGAHLEAVRSALGDGTAVGKQLGFLLQELGREVNTIGSKANDVVMSEAVIAMKGELEKAREQIENLE